MTPEPLDPFYYLHNFQTVLKSLQERYADLLSREEHDFMARFAAVPVCSRALFVRMMMRSGVLFRLSKLNYREIGATRSAASPLIESALLDDAPLLSFPQVQNLLTKAELLHHFGATLKSLAIGANARKSEIGNALVSVHVDSRPFADWCADSAYGVADRVYALREAPLCERLRLLFFGNFRQDWSEFVLAELGIFAYERVSIAAHSRAFSRRSHIEDFQRLYGCREMLHADAPLPEILAAMPARIDGCEWLEDRRQKLLFQIARHCERQEQIDTALQLYAACSHAGARARQIRLYERLQRWESAASLCAEVLHSAQSETERQQAERAAQRVNRRLGLQRARVRRAVIPEFELYLDRPTEVCPVEHCVRDFLARSEPDGAAVEYVENGLINSLFGLLCWRAVFAPVAGAFFHDFHHAPADFADPQFYRRRERDFAACLAELESGEYAQTIRATHVAKLGIQSPFVAWGLLNEALLGWALTCFPAEHLRCWFEWIVRDVRSNRTGFPDLVQFWPAERRYRLIEVKGPGDRLQDNQRRLLEFCLTHRMPVSVCHVRWSESSLHQGGGAVK